MNNFLSYKLLLFLGLGFVLNSCSDSKDNDYSAYFGGEIINPKDKWVLFYKGEELLDSIPLDKNNRFFIKFDSLPSGLYTFRHEPEYQYVHFEKNDSLMVRINTFNFDESLVFCGKGEEKNNFLVEMYLRSQKDRNTMFSTFDLTEKEFSKKADSSYQEALKFYNEKKQYILWSDEFDIIAKASVDFPYYTKKEFYPIAHKKRAVMKNYPEVSSSFYAYRKNIDLNNSELVNYSPYLRYVTTLVDNIAKTNNQEKLDIRKLEVIDSLTSNQDLKNKITGHIAFFYLIEKENNINDSVFIEKFYKVSKDEKKKEEIKTLVNSIKNISENGYLPEVILKDIENNDISSANIFNKKTIVYFWSKKNTDHFLAVHKKLNKIIDRHPDIDVIGISLDENPEEWKSFLEKNKTVPHPKIRQYKISNLDTIKDKWVITRATRSSIVDKDGKIIKGFVNIFDTTFEKEL